MTNLFTACHTHSPKAGQGMNVSMMDSFNLSWKLAHSILGLTPQTSDNGTDTVLETFEAERVDTARQLIEFDAKFSHMFSGKLNAETGLTHDEFLKVFRDGSGFTSGCGLEYKPSRLVWSSQNSDDMIVATGDPINGALTVGRRFLNVELKRYADNTTRQLHDGRWFPSTTFHLHIQLTSHSYRASIKRTISLDGTHRLRPSRAGRSVSESIGGMCDHRRQTSCRFNRFRSSTSSKRTL